MDMQRHPEHPSINITPIVVFGVLALLFGGFMYWIFPDLNVVPPRASIQAEQTDELFRILMGIGGVVFFLVQGLIYYAAIAFRAKAGDFSEGPGIHGNTMLEVVWTIIPSVIVVILAILSFRTWRNNTEVSATPNLINGESISVNVTGQQFTWMFEYVTNELDQAQNMIVINSPNLHVYVGEDVNLDLRTNDVLHAFWVPAMRMKQDLLPGRISEVRFTPVDPQDDGWHFAGVQGPASVYAEADDGAEVLLEIPAAAEGEYLDSVQLEFVDPDAEVNFDDDDDSWLQVITPGGQEGYVRESNVTGRYNIYPIICAELCGGGHGYMQSTLYLYESDTALLDTWYNIETSRRTVPPQNPIVIGRSLTNEIYGCAGCHTLDSQGWTGVVGPNLNGIADRVGERAGEISGVESGAEYIAHSIRMPGNYLVPGYNNLMRVFDPATMPQEDLNAIVTFLCSETNSGAIEDNTCGLENYVVDDAGEPLDTDALLEELTALTDEYQ